MIMSVMCMMAMTAEAVELVRDGNPKASIVAPLEGPPAYAAEVLQRYIERMSGAQLPIVSDGQKAKGCEGCHPRPKRERQNLTVSA
jgi:hypothetical protein